MSLQEYFKKEEGDISTSKRPQWIASIKMDNEYVEIGAMWVNRNKKNEEYMSFKINNEIGIDLNKVKTIYFNQNKN